jgi:hypothetical protein
MFLWPAPELTHKVQEDFKNKPDHPELCLVCGKRLIRSAVIKPTGMTNRSKSILLTRSKTFLLCQIYDMSGVLNFMERTFGA